MTTKPTANGLTKQEAGWVAAIEKYFAKMALIRKQMIATDERIRQADQAIRRSQDETRAILRSARKNRMLPMSRNAQNAA
ncbi:MAG: hypothetical protein EB141_06585 [Verrucomicrobia bacterium]|nr:hypothetical protein [Pseudomonadota bacterium]NDB75299.1 hypothetical protein [Verrucomicrobiota bacterium]